MKLTTALLPIWIPLLLTSACGGEEPAADEVPDAGKTWSCVLEDDDPDFTVEIGCYDDYSAVASTPVSASIPGALSSKTLIDRLGGDSLYFQNSRRYQIHYDFASTQLSGGGLPIVPMLSQFNQTEYFSPDRRFILGALSYYEGPDVWAYEIAPYDTASAELIELAFRAIASSSYIGDVLKFHPTSDSVAVTAEALPDDIPIIATDDLFDDYQPLNLGTSYGELKFLTEVELDAGDVSFRDIAVLDTIPNDISVVSGIITGEFQTPLSHINVLSQNRGTPNMGLKGAFTNEELRALEGEWVKLTVGPFEYEVVETTKEEADAWWEANKPDKVSVPNLDLSVTELTDIEDILDIEGLGLGDALAAAIPAFGGKASHFGAFPHIPDGKVPYPKAFAIPVYYYNQFMVENGFDEYVAEMLADDEFTGSSVVRKERLETFQDEMEMGTINPDFEVALLAKLNAEYPGVRTRFRSSTNAEDLDGFTGAGLYTSRAGDPNDPAYPVFDAIRKVWASVWNFRAFEEREYRSISHTEVGMALLVHRSFPTEESNGVAVTGNIFDSIGAEPAFYVNVQVDDVSVVFPPEGVSTEAFLYYYDMPGQPIVYLGESNMVAPGQRVLSRSQVIDLGEGLRAIHQYFNELYGPATADHFYAMDVEFKFDQWEYDASDDEQSVLVIKQARPYPGWGMEDR